jgi:hypothetical protein
VTREQLAALRAWLQGVAVEAIAGRYLASAEETPDARLAHRQILEIRDALMLRAQQHGRADLAQLLERPARHSDKGMSRASGALGQLEALGSPRPDPAHAVELWFAPVLARRLRAAGLTTIDALQGRRQARGTGWWRQIPKVGAIAAGALERWLDGQGRASGGTVAAVTRHPASVILASDPAAGKDAIAGAARRPGRHQPRAARTLCHRCAGRLAGYRQLACPMGKFQGNLSRLPARGRTVSGLVRHRTR